MSSPPSPETGSADFDSVASGDYYRRVVQRARAHFRLLGGLACACLALPTLLFALSLFLAFRFPLDVPGDRKLFVAVFGLLFCVGLLAALTLFIRAGEQYVIVRRNERAASHPDPVLKGAELTTTAAGLEQHVEAFRRRVRLAVGLGGAVALALAAALMLMGIWQDLWAAKRGPGLVAVLALLLVLVALAPAGLLLRQGRVARREADLANLGIRLHLAYQPRVLEGQLAAWERLPLFRHGSDHSHYGLHLLHGDLGGRPVRTLVYGYRKPGFFPRSRYESPWVVQTVVLTRADVSLPDFRLEPERHEPHLEGKGLEPGQVRLTLEDLKGGPELVRAFRLYAHPKDAEALRALLSSALVAWLLGHQTTVEAAGGLVAVYTPEQRWEAGQYETKLTEALELFDLLTGKGRIC